MSDKLQLLFAVVKTRNAHLTFFIFQSKCESNNNAILKLYEKENDVKNEDEKRLKSEAFFRKGRSFLRLGKLHKSIENFNEAIKFRSNHVFAYIMKGFALQDIKRNSESREIFENCLNLIETESMKEKKNELKFF